MKTAILAATTLLAATAFFGAPALAASSRTENFVHDASIGNEFEIQSSRLALTRTSQRQVRDFAEMMIADHSTLGSKLKETVAHAKLGLTPPTALDDDHQALLDELKASSASSFDRLYIADQAQAHQEAIDLFESYADDGDNESLRRLASDALPTLRKHEEMIHNLDATFVSAK